MSNGSDTGAVKFRGDPGTNCIEAGEYREEGSETLNPGDVIEGIPRDMLKRFLLNQDFAPEGQVAEKVYEDLQNERRTADRRQTFLTEAPLSLDMTKDELLAAAERIGVEVKSSDTKAEILDAIEDAEGGNA